MAMKTIVSMNEQGRLTVPVEARRALRIEAEAQFEVEVADDVIVLRPVITIPREDAWASTPEHLRRVEQARRDAREGRTRRFTEDELEQLATE